MLKVVGILYIIFAFFTILLALIYLINVDYWDRVLPIPGGMSWSTYYIAGIFGSLYSLVAGIFALAFCGRVQKAGFLIFLAIVSLVSVIVFYFFSALSGAMAAMGAGLSLIFLPLDLILPIIFLVGAVRNHKSTRMPQPY